MRSVLWLGLYGAAVLAVPCLVSLPRSDSPGSAAVQPARPGDEARLTGMWSQHEAGREGDPIGFYYFHGDGRGLYRYGRVGFTNTHSFDYGVRDGKLGLEFRKTGAEHTLPFRVEREGGREWLVLESDPEAEGRTSRYFRVGGSVTQDDLPLPQQADPGPPPAGHMWIDHRRFATGGAGFSFYQFRPAGIDGRGVGWHHRGDFDDWSTESLTYRIVGDQLELRFDLSGQHAVTAFSVEGEGRDRTLRLAEDPRDFWHAHRFRDLGPSFGAHGGFHPAVLGPTSLEVPGR